MIDDWLEPPWPPYLRASDESGLRIVVYALGALVIVAALGLWAVKKMVSRE